MSSGNSSKKRKVCQVEEEDEEAKMETFFALVRNIRDTRDRWIGLRSGDSKLKKGEIMRGKEESKVGVWKPKFQLEDFADEEARCGNSDPSLALVGDASRSKTCGKEEDAEKGIDLSLSL
uniref:Uncharacterized protein n=2 Tax=Cajanus cajan TaxID=3821 RepID=A0A151SMR8_CAJCA|nr:hypothetical protein KK1_002368 [Cajanus cajan]